MRGINFSKAEIKQIFDRFNDTTPHPYQGRIVLFGLDGIGKTQTTLEYVYCYQSSYIRIYWIMADNLASLLNGYQKITKRSELQISIQWRSQSMYYPGSDRKKDGS